MLTLFKEEKEKKKQDRNSVSIYTVYYYSKSIYSSKHLENVREVYIRAPAFIFFPVFAIFLGALLEITLGTM